MPVQFGAAVPGRHYKERSAAFGILVRDGQMACVHVERGEESYHDLPGGAVDGAENESEAVVREFLEETGLFVRPVERLIDAGQYFLKSDGEPVNNLGGVWTVEWVADDMAAKVEDDHALVWMDPVRALTTLRHEAHAWAVAVWLRKRGGSELR